MTRGQLLEEVRMLRRKVQEAMDEDDNKYRLVVQKSNEAILILQEGTVKFFNPKALELTGYSSDELSSKLFPKLVYIEDQQIFNKEYNQKRVNGKPPRSHTLRLIDKQQKIKWIEINFSRIEWEGSPARLCFLKDITEQKRLQEELGRAQRLETAGRVAGQIAHDFNNLLSPLAAYPKLIREELGEHQGVFELLDQMEDAANKIAEINQELLSLGRRGHYTMEPVDLNRLIHQVVISKNIPKEIQVQENLASELLLIKAGAAQLSRTLFNLIMNAIEAMHGKGILTVSTKNTYLEKPLKGYQTVTSGEFVQLQISDTGTGIKAENIHSIFDPFFSTKKMDRIRGTGLGLSVVHGIVEDHGGYILVDTKYRKGTTFTLYFPVARDMENELAATVETSQGGSERILIIDDDPIQRRVARHLLKRLGYKVSVVSSGERAVVNIKKHRYDLLVMDMVMDGIDGAEAFRQILEIKPDQKAIILSGYAMSNRVEEALRLGAGSFVAKPVTQRALANAVRRELDRKKPLRRRRRQSSQVYSTKL
ncbi:response regulator [bacterium]|nr:response regulator [bacterium]